MTHTPIQNYFVYTSSEASSFEQEILFSIMYKVKFIDKHLSKILVNAIVEYLSFRRLIMISIHFKLILSDLVYFDIN